MAEPINERHYDWSPLVGISGRVVGVRAWMPESKGWIHLFFRDHMRREDITAAVFCPSYNDWRGSQPSDPRAPIAVTLDLAHVKHQHQPVPVRR